MVICLERVADLHIAQLIPLLLTVSCSSKIQIGFSFLVPVHLGSPGQRAVKRVCVCGQHDGLCPFWQPARSIFTVLLCCVFFFEQINPLSLPTPTISPLGLRRQNSIDPTGSFSATRTLSTALLLFSTRGPKPPIHE